MKEAVLQLTVGIMYVLAGSVSAYNHMFSSPWWMSVPVLALSIGATFIMCAHWKSPTPTPPSEDKP